MTVFIDDAFGADGCRLTATTNAELRAAAERLGCEDGPRADGHFDISLVQRAAAIELGATEISIFAYQQIMIRRNRGNDPHAPLMSLDEANAWIERRYGAA